MEAAGQQPTGPVNGIAPALRRWAMFLAALMVLIVLVARLTGASDLHDQTQEKTSAYTTDLVLHAGDWRRWILPLEQGAHPATKPPLYNWLAAPGVWLTEGRWDWPHRLPSLAAFAAVAALLWTLGRRLDPKGLTGTLAVIVLCSNYAWFKLSALIRPDTLLSLWLVLGWVGVTVVLSGEAGGRAGRLWRGVIWLACALAVLTKGPAALLIPAFAAVLAGVDAPKGGRARRAMQGLRECGALWGLPLVFVVTAAWLALVWRIDPSHLYDTLLREEFVERALGTGEEGVKEGPWDFIRTALNMPLYFISRFLPWSVFFFGVLLDLRAQRRGEPRGLPAAAARGAFDPRWWVTSAVTWTVLVIAAFTLAAGKRADYIASAYVPAALAVAWGLGHLGWALARRFPAAVAALAIATLAGLIVHDRVNGYAVKYPLSESLRDFAREVRPIIERQPVALEFYRTGAAPLQVMLHRSQPVLLNVEDLAARMESHGEAWLIASDRSADEALAEAGRRGWTVQEVASSEPAKGSVAAPPLQMRLYRVMMAERGRN